MSTAESTTLIQATGVTQMRSKRTNKLTGQNNVGRACTTKSPAVQDGSSAPSRYLQAGWFQWPDHEEYTIEFMRVLGAAQEGASTISECLLAATLITPGDDEGWYRAWRQVAKANHVRGNNAIKRGGVNTAISNWLRASNYYRTAGAFLGHKDPRRRLLMKNMKKCSRRYLENLPSKGEVLRVPFDGKRELEGYFIRAPSNQPLLPVVICLGGMDVSKDDLLYTMPRNAAGNGLSLLMIDLLGFETVTGREKATTPIDVEVPISRWVDYLLTRGDIDPSRIAIYGDGLGASYATRAASHDQRFATAVCDGGLWARQERMFVMGRMADKGYKKTVGETAWMIGSEALGTKLIKCPHLIVIGQCDYVTVETAKDTYDSNKRMGLRPSLKIFSTEETGAFPGQIDNPTLAKEFAFDWIREQLKVDPT